MPNYDAGRAKQENISDRDLTMHNGHEGGRVNIINTNWNKSTKLKTE